jgi:Putative Ig domain
VAVVALAACVPAATAAASPTALSFSPNKGAPGTRITATASGSLSCVSDVTLTSVTGGTPVSATMVSNNGTNVVFEVPSLPAGNANVDMSDGANSASCAFSGVLQVVNALRITSTSLPAAGYGVPYSARITAAGGVGPYSWTVIAGAPPSGVSLASNGVFQGSPRSSAPATLTAQVMDKYGATASATFTITVEAPPTISISSLPDGTVGVYYSAKLTAAGGVSPYSWSVGPSGGLPGGLVVSSVGVLSGRPGTPGTSMLNLQVTDAAGVTGTATVSITINPIPEEYAVAIADGALPVGDPSLSDPLLHVRSPQGGVVALASGRGGKGFWALTRTGRVRGVKGMRSLGSLPKLRRGVRPVALASDPTATGYWVLTNEGQVFAFGHARRYPNKSRHASASRSAKAVGLAAASEGGGYWILWSDGEVDAYGDAPVLGSAGPAGYRFTAIAATADGPGYWVVTSSGRVFPFGAAWGEPPTGGSVIHGEVVGIAGTPDGAGYWLLGENGTIRAFGSALLAQNLPNPLGLGRAVSIASAA